MSNIGTERLHRPDYSPHNHSHYSACPKDCPMYPNIWTRSKTRWRDRKYRLGGRQMVAFPVKVLYVIMVMQGCLCLTTIAVLVWS